MTSSLLHSLLSTFNFQLSPRRIRLFASSPLRLFALGLAVSTQPFSCFPRMTSTPSVKPYQKRMPAQPAGQQPFAQGSLYPPAKGQFVSTVTPVPKTDADAIKLGGIYYGYYCQHCHGPTARGDGSVGQSYVPIPPDLTTPKVRALSDAALTRAMIHGTGHDPVLDSTVPRDRRPLIVKYLRSLTSG